LLNFTWRCSYDILFPIHCADSLVWGGNGFETSSTKKLLGQFSLVLANPPFGSKIVALSGKARSNFELAYKWRISKKTGRYEKQSDFANNPPPQVLFVERCISLLKEGGRLGIVLPESVLSNPNHRHVVQYILDHTTPIAIIGMPESLFKTSGKGGTHTKVCLIVLEKRRATHDHQIFMAEAKWCGHDSRAKGIAKDDLPAIIDKFRDFRAGQALIPSRFGYAVPLKNIKNNILAPRFHDPSAANLINNLCGTHTLYKISDLVADGILSLSTGDEVGKLAYGSGTIPFVRTSDISGWEIKVDPKHLVDRETYLKFARKQDVREGDILMVRDGTYLIGTCAFVSQYDTEIVYQSHIYKIRVNPNNLFDNYLLLAVLSSQPVVAQIKSMSFTQDIIDTLGDRIYDIILPIPNSLERRKEISSMVKKVIEDRVEARELARKARLAVTEP
jgi:type I restriction enzyme M protein